MSEDKWGILLSALMLLILRLIDYTLPKGWHFKWVKRFSMKDKEEKEKEEAGD